MKRIASLILAVTLVIAVTACTHKTTPATNGGELTVSVREPSGRPIEGATVEIREGSRALATVTTGVDGVATARLLFGEYTLKITSLPEKYRAINDNLRINFGEGAKSFALVAEDLTEMGTEKNPYIIDGDTTVSLAAGAGAYYLIKPNGGKNTLYIPSGEALSVKINGQSVHTSNGGSITYTASGETLVLITNGGSKINAPAFLVYPFGSEENPYEARLGATYTATVTGRTLYYSFTAENAGTYLLSGISGEGVYTLTVGGSEIKTATGRESISAELSAGDTLIFTVSGNGEVSYTLLEESSELPFQPFEINES